MKNLLGLSLLVLAMGLAGPVLADHRGDAPAPADEERGADVEGATTEVTGRVLDIDHRLGALMLETTHGVLALQGPPEAIRDVNVGDVIRVRVALRENPPIRPRSDERDKAEQARR